jgi:hypothetical protein
MRHYPPDGICRWELEHSRRIRGRCGSGAPPPGVGDDDTGNCDGQDSHAVEPACTGGNMGSGHGRFVTHGGGGRRQGGGLGNGRFVRDRGDDSGACHPKITFPSFDGEGDSLH